MQRTLMEAIAEVKAARAALEDLAAQDFEGRMTGAEWDRLEFAERVKATRRKERWEL